MSTTDKQRRAYDYLEELVESNIASAKSFLSILFNRLSADDFIDMVETEFEWEDSEEPEDEDPDATALCEDCGNETDQCACSGDTCGMCGDRLGDGETECWMDEDDTEWSVHSDCYRSGRYLSRADYIASEHRMAAANVKAREDGQGYDTYAALDLEGARYYGDDPNYLAGKEIKSVESSS